MKDFNFKSGAVMSSLAVLLIAAASSNGCSTGNDTPSGAAGTNGGAGTGSTGAAGTGTSGGAGTGSTGAAGTGSTGAAGTGTGAAGTGSVTTLPVTNGKCKDAGTRPLTVAEGKIDNFEDATLSLGWSTFNDVEVGGMKNTIKMTLDAPGAVGTGHFGHYAGMGAKTPTMGGYGVGALYNAAIDTANGIYCVDVTAFDGLTFWAKAAKTGKVGVNFVIPETNMPDGDCTTACFNHPKKDVTLTTEWAQYSVPFTAAVAGLNKVNGRIQMVGFLAPDADWDFSVDEIQFYKGTPPTGAIPAN